MKMYLFATPPGYLRSVLRVVSITSAALMLSFAVACGGNGGDGSPRGSSRSIPPTISPAQFVAPPTATPEPTATPTSGARANPEPRESASVQAQARSSAPRVGPTPRVIRRASTTRREQAPDFEMETFSGDLLRLSDLEGQVVVLNFWATSCPPCRWEMPSFERIAQEYGDRGVVFVGVSVSDTAEDAQAFVDSIGLTYPIGVDPTNAIARAYDVVSLPTTFFISTDGTIERRLNSAANEGVLRIFIRGQLG